MLVATMPGHRTEALSLDPVAWRSWANDSVAAKAANFETAYGASNGAPDRPATEEVLTMCPSVPWASIRGTNARMPWRMPHRLAPSTNSKSATGRSQMSPPTNTPALLQSTWTWPQRSKTASARASTSPARLTSQTSATESGAGWWDRRSGGGLGERPAVEIGHRHLHPLPGEREGQGPPDPAAGSGHHRGLSRQLLHG